MMMTTPERLSKRQKIVVAEGAIILALSIFLTGLGYTNQQADKDQRACLASITQDLTAALDARAELTVATNDLRDQRIDLQDARMDFLLEVLVNAVRNQDRTEAERAAFRQKFIERVEEFQQRKDELRNKIETAKRDLAKVPIPPYPEGTCDKDNPESWFWN